MSGATRREQSTNETHRLIAKAAMKLFSKKGYDHVTVDEICEKAGVAKGTFYSHFKSKEHIITEQFLTAYNDSMVMIKEVEKTSLYKDKMTELMTAVFKYVNDSGVDVMRAVYYSQLGPGKKESTIASGERELYKIAEQQVSEAQEKGEVRTDIGAEQLALTIIRSGRGIVYEWCMEDGGFDLAEAAEDLIAVLIDGLKP